MYRYTYTYIIYITVLYFHVYISLVNFDEVFVKLKEISNPGNPPDSCKCGCRGSGGSDRKKSKEETWGKIHSSILCPKCPKVVDHEG